MSDSKVFMFPESERGSDLALFATLANQNNNPLAMMAAMGGGGFGGNAMWNNPFIYLVWMMYAQRMWGNNGLFGDGNGQTLELQNQISAIREQLGTNQNTSLLMDAIKGNSSTIGQLSGQINCDFNTLNSAICDVRASIDKVASITGFSAERVINAVQSGDASIASQLAQCCCTIREAVTQQGYENQIATLNQTNTLQNSINTVATGQERGFSSVAYETQRQTCDLQNSIKDAVSEIKAGQRAAEMRELQREITERDRTIAKQDVIINNGQQTAIFSQMINQATTPLATALGSLQNDVNGIKCKLPETVSVPYPQLTAIPSCAANALGAFGLYNGFGNWGAWNNNTLWG